MTNRNYAIAQMKFTVPEGMIKVSVQRSKNHGKGL
jgi:hypothetical protein